MGNFSGKTDDSESQSSQNSKSSAQTQDSSKPKSKGRYKVQLAASVLGGTGPFTAYHTSVLVDGTECMLRMPSSLSDTHHPCTVCGGTDFFDMGGVMSTNSLASHQGRQPVISDIGFTNKSASSMQSSLRQYFSGGSYDLLRKNCNSFSDCALWYLCRERLPGSYNRMEKLGNSEMLGSLVQSGEYKANPKADAFDKDKVLDACKGVFEKSEGLQVGGQNVESKDDMKAKRLAMLEKRMGMK